MSFQGYGNLAIPYIEIIQYYQDKVSGYHAINLVLNDAGKVYGFEPQSAITFDMSTPEPGFLVDEQRIYWVEL